MNIQISAILDCVQVPIILLKNDFSVLEMNTAALTFYNWRYDDVVGKKLFTLCHDNGVELPVTVETLNNALVLSNANVYFTNVSNKNLQSNSKWNVTCSTDIIDGENVFVLGMQLLSDKLLNLFHKNNFENLLAKSMVSLISRIGMITRKNVLREEVVNLEQLFFDSRGFSFNDVLQLLPGEVYWEDRNLTYLGCNDYCAEVIGLASTNDLANKDDLFIKKVMNKNYPDGAAELWPKTARMVMESRKAIINKDDLTCRHPDTGAILSFRTSKIPIIDDNGTAIGVLGITIDQNNPKHIRQLRKADLLLQEIIQTEAHKSTINYLSAKEFECVKCRAHGKGIKQIAAEMNLSPRTVETYLNRAKLKTKCFSSNQLSQLYWEYCGNG